MIRILLAHSHPMVLYGLERLFRGDPDFAGVRTCRDGLEATQAIREERPNVALLEANLAGNDALTVARELLKEIVSTNVIISSSPFAEQDVIDAMRAGVRGMLLSTMSPEIILRCARKVANGDRWLEMDSHARAFDSLLRTTHPRPERDGATLSAREA